MGNTADPVTSNACFAHSGLGMRVRTTSFAKFCSMQMGSVIVDWNACRQLSVFMTLKNSTENRESGVEWSAQSFL